MVTMINFSIVYYIFQVFFATQTRKLNLNLKNCFKFKSQVHQTMKFGVT